MVKHRLLGVVVTSALVISAFARADDAGVPSEEFVPDSFIVSPDGHLGLPEVGQWPEIDRRAIGLCGVLVFAGESPKKATDGWEKEKKSLFTRLRADAATLPGAQRAQAPKVIADAVVAFRDACIRGASALAGESCSRVRLVGGVPVLSYVTSRAGWCEVRDGTKKDLQKWIRLGQTEAERLSRTENLKTLNACGKLAAQRIEWDYVRPKRSEYPSCTVPGADGDDDSFPE